MRARNIKPGFFKNEDLAECSMAARLLFAGLWCIADREGRLEDRPKRIKAEILPYDNEDADSLLSELETTGFIVRYQAQGYKVISIPKFLQHQRPHSNEKESELPPLDEGEHTKVESTADHGSKPCEPLTQALRPSSLNPESHESHDSHDSHGEEGGEVVSTSSPENDTIKRKKNEKKNIPPYSQEFERFWSAYPKKVGKGGAYKAWQRVKEARPSIKEIERILEQQRNSVEWNKEGGQYIPNPQTWLNQYRWEDQLTPLQSGPNQKRPEYVH
jgi:hypothetical protein